MRTLSASEKRTVRIGGIGIAIYLLLFGGFKVWKFFDQKRTDYLALVAQAQQLRAEVKSHEARIAHVSKLMEQFHLNPAALNRSTLMLEVNSAIQKTATSAGVAISTLRESPQKLSGRELASIQLEGTGPVQATMTFLHKLTVCGYPLIIDSVQLNANPMQQGQLKFNLTVIIFDFEQWKTTGVPHA